MLKVYVWTTENGNYYRQELRHLKPRRYMCGWSFERMMKYIREELYWNDINEEDITSIEIANEKEHWQQSIKRA